MQREIWHIQTRGRGFHDLTVRLRSFLRSTGVRDGLCNLFLQHTSASLLITENADPAVHRDLERAMARLAPDGDPLFEHDAEGPDDMPAHLRTALTQSSLTLPVMQMAPALGTWQGIYLWEHRQAGHERRVIATAW